MLDKNLKMTPQQALSNICVKCRDVDICINSEDGIPCDEYNILMQTMYNERIYKSILKDFEQTIKEHLSKN